jgi:hypothetical protein
MGNFTPKPIIQQINKTLTSKGEKANNEILKKDMEFVIKNTYKKLKIKNRAPNCVQKNIR